MTPEDIAVMWEHAEPTGNVDVMITWRATDGHTRVGYVTGEWMPGVYSARMVQTVNGVPVVATALTVYADEISFAQYVRTAS